MESSADGTFWVVDSLGNLLANVDAELSGTESAKFTLEQPGPHFVQFSIASGDYGEFTIASNVPLTPIEDPDDGGRIAVGQTVIGNFDSPEDVDFFIVSLEEGDTVYVEADSLNANMYLTIGFPGWTSNQLVFDDDSAGGLRGVNAGVVYRAIKSAPHFIVLGDAVGSNTGGYFLSVREALPGEAPVAIPPSPEFVDTAFGRMLVYESPAGFSVQVPADWLEIEVDPSAGQVFGATSALEESVVIIEEDVTAFLSLSTLDEYADFLETYLFEADPGIDVTSRTTVQTSGGVTVERFELSVAGGVVQAYRYVHISDTGIGFNLVYIFPGERFDAGKGLAEYSVGTLTPALGTASSDASDRAALVALYNATDGPNWLNNTSWLTDTPIGKWHGVTTDDGGRVTELDLRYNRLSGKIPPELGNLINLTWLSLSQNQLSGEIPTELGNLSNLTVLDLRGDGLSGKIPAELASLSNLTELDLSDNELSGEIPPELGSLSNLTKLDLGHNQLGGGIPSELGSLSNLAELGLGYNQLSGKIPPELGSLSNLTELWLAGNQLSGCVPDGLRGVRWIDLSYRGRPFCDAEPAPTSPDRAALVALYNATDGPNWLNNTSWLTDTPIGKWHGVTTDDGGRVTELDLRDNRLSGEIPTELGNLINLTGLSLSQNQLSGEIPTELGNLINLTWLNLSQNQLSGEIPTELGNLINLTGLSLSQNQLSGEIPTELGNLINLTLLSLSQNELSGEIPTELGNLINLTWLNLSQNQLSGEIPTELGNLINLITGLSLSQNQLSGEIPTELGNLINLTWLILFRNELSGEIPTELGNLINLTWLNLSQNQLSGEIPTELGNLINLTLLSLSQNQLSGCIPTGLRDVAENDLTGLGLPFCGT